MNGAPARLSSSYAPNMKKAHFNVKFYLKFLKHNIQVMDRSKFHKITLASHAIILIRILIILLHSLPLCNK